MYRYKSVVLNSIDLWYVRSEVMLWTPLNYRGTCDLHGKHNRGLSLFSKKFISQTSFVSFKLWRGLRNHNLTSYLYYGGLSGTQFHYICTILLGQSLNLRRVFTTFLYFHRLCIANITPRLGHDPSFETSWYWCYWRAYGAMLMLMSSRQWKFAFVLILTVYKT